MKQTTKEKILNMIERKADFLAENIDLHYIGIDWDNPDQLRECIEAMIFESEIIYYHNAMNFLKEHDPSLRESLALAKDMGIFPTSSEQLATILFQELLMQDIPDLDEIFDIALQEEEEEEEEEEGKEAGV